MVSSVPPALKKPRLEAEPTREVTSSPMEVPTVAGTSGVVPGQTGFRQYFLNIYRAVTSIFEGLTVTKSWLFRRPFTVQYPDKIEKPVQEMLPPTYRGILEVDLGLCTGCMLCTRNCPIGTIDIKVGKNTETGVREISKFDVDMGQCMFCGLCVESCKFKALVHTTEFEATVQTPEELILHFVTTPQPVAKHKRGEEPERHRPGTILPEVIPAFGKRKPVFEKAPRREKPTGAKPADAKPADAKPADAKPADAKPTGTKPEGAKPEGAKPADAKPADAKPADAKPADAKPADVKPASEEPEK